MAGLIVLVAVLAVAGTREKIQQRRSPLLQLPSAEEALAPIGSGSDESQAQDGRARPMTEFTLVKFLRKWTRREAELSMKLRALLIAQTRGIRRCWAGEWSDFGRILAARDEAKFVRDQFAEAILWCDDRKVKRTKWSFVLGLKRDGSLRNQHDQVPPSLYLLPLPFPRPPKDDDYSLQVLLPPPLAPREIDMPPPPPLYSEKVADGEELMQTTQRDETLAGPST